jgi:hypothetical protein
MGLQTGVKWILPEDHKGITRRRLVVIAQSIKRLLELGSAPECEWRQG